MPALSMVMWLLAPRRVTLLPFARGRASFSFFKSTEPSAEFLLPRSIAADMSALELPEPSSLRYLSSGTKVL